MGSPVSRAIWVLRATRVRVEYKDPEERTDLRAPRVPRDPMENLVPWVQLERRENSESLDCPDTLEGKVQRVPTVSLVSREPMARKERGEPPANPAREANADQRAHVADAAPEDRRENQVLRAHQATTDPPVHQERGDLKDHRDRSVSPDLKDQMAHQEKMGCPDTQDREERRASKERPDLQDPEGWLDRRVQPERWDPAASVGTQVLPVHLVSKVYPELLEKRVERVIQVPRGAEANLVPQA